VIQKIARHRPEGFAVRLRGQRPAAVTAGDAEVVDLSGDIEEASSGWISAERSKRFVSSKPAK
jgi:hypothetical protein